MPAHTPELTSTQVGAIAENVVANLLMIESLGRLSPFWPLADDDGIDLLIYDKVTGMATPVQVKSRTKTLKKKGSEDRGNVVHFEVRTAAAKDSEYAHLLAVLLTDDLTSIDCCWYIPMKAFLSEARRGKNKLVIRPSRSANSKDKFVRYRCESPAALAERATTVLQGRARAAL
jgi:hypothetical protein